MQVTIASAVTVKVNSQDKQGHEARAAGTFGASMGFPNPLRLSDVNIFRNWAAAALLAVLAAAGCGGTSAPLTRSGPTPTAPTVTLPGTPSPSATAPGTSAQQVSVTPATGLAAIQKILVQASGFVPGESLVVTECAAKSTATGPGDCDLTSMQAVTADAGGHVRTEFTVRKGPFGANNIICGAAQGCLLSVTQATLSPAREADTPLSFAP